MYPKPKERKQHNYLKEHLRDYIHQTNVVIKIMVQALIASAPKSKIFGIC